MRSGSFLVEPRHGALLCRRNQADNFGFRLEHVILYPPQQVLKDLGNRSSPK